VDLDAGIDQHPLVHAVQARDLAVLVPEQRLPVEARLADRPAVRGSSPEILTEMRGVGEEFLGDAADVDAGAAEAAVLGDRDLGAVARGNAARAYAARAAADREKVVIENQTAGRFTSDWAG
jgi:hypothetical protein